MYDIDLAPDKPLPQKVIDFLTLVYHAQLAQSRWTHYQLQREFLNPEGQVKLERDLFALELKLEAERTYFTYKAALYQLSKEEARLTIKECFRMNFSQEEAAVNQYYELLNNIENLKHYQSVKAKDNG